MKELTIEQKAKAYDEAIKIAMSKIKNNKDHVLYEEDIVDIFPELKESEDGENKRISKEITQFLKKNNGWNREWLAWLEKQGEQKKR